MHSTLAPMISSEDKLGLAKEREVQGLQCNWCQLAWAPTGFPLHQQHTPGNAFNVPPKQSIQWKHVTNLAVSPFRMVLLSWFSLNLCSGRNTKIQLFIKCVQREKCLYLLVWREVYWFQVGSCCKGWCKYLLLHHSKHIDALTRVKWDRTQETDHAIKETYLYRW